ncbi:hypothetical protein BJ165DRAFT_1339803 [Panaeolus papilionaceus]|nr:hypothetical protein BJ165DRAFT_1339803 [Panaeolus papilionaceus]
MSSSLPLSDLVKNWIQLDANPTTKSEIQKLWDEGQTEVLEQRLRNRIEFGTAGMFIIGLRGRMEAGWSRMNDLIILQTSQGLAEYVSVHVENALRRGIVIGYDHRHNSERWAQLTAQTFASKGFAVHFLEGLNHTPLVPFIVKHVNAACGVMITASHNPKQDNGYKVYWENGVQIIGPHDEGIASAIQNHLDVQPAQFSIYRKSSDEDVTKTHNLRDEYFAALKCLSSGGASNLGTSIKVVNTSMHGVSDEFVRRAFQEFGIPAYIPVGEQQLPDPEFPTVKFPNPEEKVSLTTIQNLALETADRNDAKYVIAQDPDSDRFVAAEKGYVTDGKWFVFTGDQLGSIFAYHVLQRYKKTGKPIAQLAMVASTVSSKMVEAMAHVEGFKFVDCLTGFKFIGNTALDLTQQGYEVPFGYEEAIGFMFGTQIRDKDGVSATVVFMELLGQLLSEGKTVGSHLDDLYQKYGYFQTSNSYFVSPDPLITDTIFEHIRNYDGSSGIKPTYPTEIAGLPITRVVDLTVGYDSGNEPSYKPLLPLSSGHMIQFRASDEAANLRIVLTLRTSGTEPKIKYYLEGNGRDSKTIAPLLGNVVEDLSKNWVQATKHSLRRA